MKKKKKRKKDNRDLEKEKKGIENKLSFLKYIKMKNRNGNIKKKEKKKCKKKMIDKI